MKPEMLLKLKRYAFLLLVIVLFLSAAVFGLVYRRTYTDVTAEENYLEQLDAAEMPGELCVNACTYLKDVFTAAPVILRVTVTGEMENYFYVSQQKAAVKQIYAGEGLSVGQEIYITSDSWSILAPGRKRPLELERNFVNVLRVGEDYLVFLRDDRVEFYEETPVYYLVRHDYMVSFAPVFWYEDTENAVIPTVAYNTYVPYSLVKDNEFFVNSEEGLEAWKALKAEMLAKYPKLS